jgi:hypothetical protein
MRRTALTFLVLVAVLFGVFAAGSPVIGDSSVQATIAGIHLAHATPKPPIVTTPPAIDRLAFLVAALAAVTSGWWLLVAVVHRGSTSVGWRERRASRGPPRPSLA